MVIVVALIYTYTLTSVCLACTCMHAYIHTVDTDMHACIHTYTRHIHPDTYIQTHAQVTCTTDTPISTAKAADKASEPTPAVTAVTAVTAVAPASSSCARGSAAAGADVAVGGRVEGAVVPAVAKPAAGADAAKAAGADAAKAAGADAAKAAGDAPQHAQHLMLQQLRVAATALVSTALVLKQLPVAVGVGVDPGRVAPGGAALADLKAKQAAPFAASAAPFAASTTLAPTLPAAPAGKGGLTPVRHPAATNEAFFAQLDERCVGTVGSSLPVAPPLLQLKASAGSFANPGSFANAGSFWAAAAVTPLAYVEQQQLQHLQQRTPQPV